MVTFSQLFADELLAVPVRRTVRGEGLHLGLPRSADPAVADVDHGAGTDDLPELMVVGRIVVQLKVTVHLLNPDLGRNSFAAAFVSGHQGQGHL